MGVCMTQRNQGAGTTSTLNTKGFWIPVVNWDNLILSGTVKVGNSPATMFMYLHRMLSRQPWIYFKSSETYFEVT